MSTESAKRLRAERREWGVCTQCDRKRDRADRLMCASCRAKANARVKGAYKKNPSRQLENSAMRRARLKAAGLCVVCGKEAARPGVTMCEKCTEIHNNRIQAFKAWRREAGMCAKCGTEPASPGFALCEKCAEKNRAYQKEYHQKKRKGTQ